MFLGALYHEWPWFGYSLIGILLLIDMEIEDTTMARETLDVGTFLFGGLLGYLVYVA